MFVKATVKWAVRPNTIVVPQKAVQQTDNGHVVFLATPQGIAEVRPVMVGEWVGNDWVIKQGLKAGEQVIVNGFQKLKPGSPVKVTGTLKQAAAATPVTPPAPAAKPHIRQALQFKYDGSLANEYNHPIWRAIKYVNVHLMDHITLEETAKECGMSLSCFQRAFKREVGMTFNKYVNTIRISKARQLLHENSKTMSEIAFACGYTNQYHFTRTFKRFSNMPPRSFRKSLSPEPSPRKIRA